jgi:SAM-dependent methyltransferase
MSIHRTSPGNQASHLLEALERDLLISLADPKAGERLLEVGCGLGRRLKIFRDRGLEVMGLEADQVLVDAARRSIGNNSLVRFGEPGELPFEDNAFDLVLLGHGLTRAFDPATALAEAGRVARQRIVVETLNPYSLNGLNQRLQGRAEVSEWLSPWRLSGMARKVFGPSRMRRVTLQTFPQAWLSWLKTVETSPLVQRFPWGGYLFLRIDLRYTVRTRPLAVSTKPAPLGPHPGSCRQQSRAWPGPSRDRAEPTRIETRGQRSGPAS